MMHLLKLFSILSIVLVTTSCLKPPSQTEDHGPVVPPVDVQKAIIEAWGDGDPSTILKNEFMYMEQDQRISTMDPRVVYKESAQVLSRDETADTISYKVLFRSTAMDETGQFKPETSVEHPIVIQKSSSARASSYAQDPAFPDSLESLRESMAQGSVGLHSKEDGQVQERFFVGVQTVISLLDACVKSENWDVTCHNLRLTEGWMAPPTGIASKPNCGGIPSCQIRYKKVAFDLVVNLPNETGGGTHQEKVIYEMTISPDVPFLSRLTEFCYQGLVQASGQRILVKICNKVQNFEVGTVNQTN